MSVCIYLWGYLFMCVTPRGQTKNDTGLKFGIHTPIDLIWNGFFVFFKKIIVTTASLENCRVPWIFRISSRLPCFLLKSLWGISLHCTGYRIIIIEGAHYFFFPEISDCQNLIQTQEWWKSTANSIAIFFLFLLKTM